MNTKIKREQRKNQQTKANSERKPEEAATASRARASRNANVRLKRLPAVHCAFDGNEIPPATAQEGIL